MPVHNTLIQKNQEENRRLLISGTIRIIRLFMKKITGFEKNNIQQTFSPNFRELLLRFQTA